MAELSEREERVRQLYVRLGSGYISGVAITGVEKRHLLTRIDELVQAIQGAPIYEGVLGG